MSASARAGGPHTAAASDGPSLTATSAKDLAKYNLLFVLDSSKKALVKAWAGGPHTAAASDGSRRPATFAKAVDNLVTLREFRDRKWVFRASSSASARAGGPHTAAASGG